MFTFADLGIIFLILAMLTLLPKKNILFVLKIFLNLPLIVLLFAFMESNLGNLLALFYSLAAYYGNLLLLFLVKISYFFTGGIFVLAGLYNLFYLSGYGYQSPVRR